MTEQGSFNEAVRLYREERDEAVKECEGLYAERDRLKAVNAELVGALRQVEAALGENLVWITDVLDPLIRQKNAAALEKLAQINAAWVVTCQAIAKAKGEAP